MSRPVRAVGIMCLLALCAEFTEAQTCAGGPALTDHAVQLGASTIVDSDAASVGLGVVGGRENIYAGVGTGLLFPTADSVPKAWSVTGKGGGIIHAGRLSICPGGEVGVLNGPNLAEINVEMRRLTIGGGATLGFVTIDTGGLRVVPTAQYLFVHSRQTVTFLDRSIAATEEGSIVSAGVGIIFRGRLAIVPGMVFPISDGDDPVRFRIAGVIGF